MSSVTIPPTRTIVMTGATRGLGKVAATTLLRETPEAHLVVIARSGGAGIADELGETSGNPHVSSVTADLASMQSIRDAAGEITRDLDGGVLPPLNAFIGNAGLQLLRATDTTEDGVESTFGVNVLANYVFLEELRGHFVPPARIVLTTSDTHFGDFKHNMGMVPAPTWRDPALLSDPSTGDTTGGAVAGRTAYSTSKLAVIYLTHALASRLPVGIDVFSFNPGLVPGTGLARNADPISRFAFRHVMPLLTLTPYARTIKTSGADLAAAAAGPITVASGSYINGHAVERSSPESYDPGREDALWDELTRLGRQADVLRRSSDSAP